MNLKILSFFINNTYFRGFKKKCKQENKMKKLEICPIETRPIGSMTDNKTNTNEKTGLIKYKNNPPVT
jgi:hypothetical protein